MIQTIEEMQNELAELRQAFPGISMSIAFVYPNYQAQSG